MNDRLIDIERRLDALTPQQRELLALRVRAEARESGKKHRRRPASLVAYVESPSPERTTPASVREFIEDRLPDYMVPQRIVVKAALPRLPNGKIDRGSLRVEPRPVAPVVAAAPLTETESTLARIWMEVLGLEELDREDDFFEVGGDSLLSIRILARANRAGLNITPEDFFAQPTLAGQAAIIDAVSTSAPEPEAAPAAADSGAFPLANLDAHELESVSRTLAALDDQDGALED